MIKNISATVITFNSEDTIFRCLNSLTDFQEVVIYDSNSTDKTLEIAQNFSNVKIYSGNFDGFGKTKNRAISLTSNSWIFSLDSDEYLNDYLLDEVKNLDLKNEKIAYKIKRDNYVLDKKIRFSGMGDDWLIRLFNKKEYQFSDQIVHEFIEIKDKNMIRKLKTPFSHIAVTDISQFLFKIAKYSKLGAESNGKKYNIFQILIKSSFSFFRTYILKFGFLDGWRGLLISVSNANGRFYKYIRLV